MDVENASDRVKLSVRRFLASRADAHTLLLR